jgi:S1-C subfamily serine protease
MSSTPFTRDRDPQLPPPPPPRRDDAGDESPAGRPGRRLTLLASIVTAVVLLVAGLGSALTAAPTTTAAPAGRTSIGTVPQSPSATRVAAGTNVRAIASAITPAVVDVNTTLASFGQGIAGRAAGTGIILTSAGEVLTNNHVIQNASTIQVTVAGRGTYPATVLGADPTHDVALLQLQGATGLPTATLADSSSLAVGEEVVAIGNALGRGGAPSVTAGTVTALGRSILARSDIGAGEHLHGLIQTDAPISPGDSGGPLVNDAGQVVGMITAGAATQTSTSTNVGFAIPTNAAVSIVDRVRSGRAGASVVIGQAGFLGIEVAPLDPVTAARTGLAARAGVVVAGVLPGGPAERAGIVPPSVITAIDGRPVASMTALGAALHRHRPGQQVAVTWVDARGTHTANVRLIAGPAV